MAKLSFPSPTAELKADALVVLLASAHGDTPVQVVGGQRLPTEVAQGLQQAVDALKLTGKAGEVTRIPMPVGPVPVAVIAGCGSAERCAGHEAVRRAVGGAVRSLTGYPTVAVWAPDCEHSVSAVAEGALLGTYTFNRYKSAAPKPANAPVESVQVWTEQTVDDKVGARAEAVAAAVAGTKDLVNMPPLDLYPQTFAEAAVQAAKGLPIEVKVLDEVELRDGGYGGLTGVGQGSARPPRLVRLAYTPKGASKHVALVGKGVTFDTGGVCLKPPAGMEAMKCDMAGAAAVLNTVVAAAKLGLGVKITGWLCLAENMASGTAIRPSDVLTILGGKTVEVLNTDAEGRLILADGLVSASRENPDLILDIATLTGAQMVALGTHVSAVMGEDALREKVVACGNEAGEQFWGMPLPEELRANLDTPVADIANVGDRMGGMLTAGLFLREFVGNVGGEEKGDRIPWAHLDIAGPSFNDKAPRGYTGKGGTGVGVRTMLTLLEKVAAGD